MLLQNLGANLIYFLVISKGMVRVNPVWGPIIALVGCFLGLTVFLVQNGVPSDLIVPFIGLWILCAVFGIPCLYHAFFEGKIEYGRSAVFDILMVALLFLLAIVLQNFGALLIITGIVLKVIADFQS